MLIYWLELNYVDILAQAVALSGSTQYRYYNDFHIGVWRILELGQENVDLAKIQRYNCSVKTY